MKVLKVNVEKNLFSLWIAIDNVAVLLEIQELNYRKGDWKGSLEKHVAVRIVKH